ncbi:Rieske (2Fe-2S) iron-sulfur domain protein [Kyrpidia tusciae DSM 2912]|uniref:Rieske (2Fe-2S) iron-sulfur domain protein n=2 Tax=Kyrpidia TaxID=1129704 RepID=D5WUF3_KYRT2|nr:Rieske (2Fe-2S) iron-sulfur domain protein [Kyrpidia tusciae DSM 2912]
MELDKGVEKMALVKIASVGELEPGQMKRVQLGEADLALYRVGDEYYATADLCTHATASLSEGTLEGYIVQCPKHGGRFDVRTGAAVHLPAFTPVQTYEVTVRDGGIWIDDDDV